MLRRRDAGDSDRRLTVLSAEQGKIDVVAKGAKKAGSRLAGISEPLTMSSLAIVQGKRSAFITQAQPLSSFRRLRADYDRLQCGLAFAELVAAVCPYEQPMPDLYELVGRCLGHLEVHPKPLVALIWCEMRLMDSTGFHPEFERCVVSGASIGEAEPYVSPHAGGYVCDAEAMRFTDRTKTRAEVLYGLARLAALAEPPSNLKFAAECAATLFPFWRALAESPLPANDALVKELRQSQPSVN